MQQLIRKAAITTIASLGLLGAVLAPAAGASGNGKAATQQGGSAWTEDNDTNDGGTRNNVVDDGDNRHPSGKDRSVEKGGSGNQGRTTSDPDDDGRGPDRSNGGPDKPNGSGGVDLADQDGNNGCGNDDDFEDDNEGWCGRNPERGGKADVEADTTDAKADEDDGTVKPFAVEAYESDDYVKGEPTECPEGMIDVNGDADGGCVESEGAVLGNGTTTGGAAGVETGPEGEVLSAGAERPAEVSARSTGVAAATSGELFSVGGLAFTGANTLVLLAVALVLLAIGWALVRNSRRAEATVRR